MDQIQRDVETQTIDIAISQNLSDAFEFSLFSMLTVSLPAAWTAASIGFKVSPTQGGTYLPLYDENGNLVQISSPSVSTANAAPAELAGAIWVKLWSQDGAGGDTAQAAARTLTLVMKS